VERPEKGRNEYWSIGSREVGRGYRGTGGRRLKKVEGLRRGETERGT